MHGFIVCYVIHSTFTISGEMHLSFSVVIYLVLGTVSIINVMYFVEIK